MGRAPGYPGKRQPLAKVELRVFPPLYYRMSPQRVGVLVLEQAINQGETLGHLLGRLQDGNADAWEEIYDAQAHRLRPVVVAHLNSTILPSSTAAQTSLSDGDQITFHLVYGGG